MGITVLGALAVLIVGVVWLKEYGFGNKSRIWHVTFPETGGLGKSDEVQVNGIRKGAVHTMELVGDRVMVDLALDKDVVLTNDSRVAIRSVGMMGERVIAVDLKSTGAPYSPRDTIQGIYEMGLAEVMADLGNTTSSVSTIAERLNNLVGVMDENGDLSGALRNFRQTSEELRMTVAENRAALRQTFADFSSTARTARGLTTGREAELRRAIDNFSQTAENMNRLSNRLDSLRSTIQSVSTKVERGQGTLGKLVNDEKLYADLNSSIQSFKLLVEDIKANPKKYLKVEIF
ncbi:MAG TPA: MlaD family protein [Candidatus Eisenbacteria bacterium]|nr:MlaD family protein [Candidatus Eisenbacteria bacterium]